MKTTKVTKPKASSKHVKVKKQETPKPRQNFETARKQFYGLQ